MTSTASWLRLQRNIVTPPTEGNLEMRGVGSIISLRGSTVGIEVRPTWHIQMVVALMEAGYRDKIYVPCRLGADLGDYNPALNLEEKKNNERAFQASIVHIFYQPKDTQIDLQLILPFVIEAERQSRNPKVAYIIGADEPKVFGLGEHDPLFIYKEVENTAQAAYEAIEYLRER